MKNYTRQNRILSMLLVLVMVFAMLPISAFAADTSRTADTIFFATDRHEETSKLQSLLQALDYEPGLVVLGGDHVNNTNSGSLASITSEIQEIYPGVQTFYTYAAHDPNVTEDSSNPYAFARTGEVYEGEDYYVYGVDQDDMQTSSSASTAASAFKTWAASADSSKVIFVMCHMPIHSRRGDNAGGATWMTALNEVGESHDVVFLWGHNHTGESSADTSVYFVDVGGSLTPQGGSAGTINFTYMNAGYIKNGYASQVVIESDHVDVTRYTSSGTVDATHSFERRFAVSHTWEVTEYVAAACETDGYQTAVCTDCGEVKTTVISAAGHELESAVQDTCTGSYTVYTCTVCGYSYSEQNPTETTYDAASGLEEGESYVIVASNYALTYGSSAGRTSVTVTDGSITSEVSEAMVWTYEDGMLSNSSSGSKLYISVSSSSSGSSNRPGSSSSSRTITFTTSGVSVSYGSSKLQLGSYYLYHSSNSGFSARSSGSTVTLYQVNEAMGSTGEHIYETVTVDATCTENGSVTYTCISCGYSYTETIEAGGSHTYESVTVDATCAVEGAVAYTCTVCGDSYTETIPATGDHENEVITVEATCTSDGSVTTNCVICGKGTVEVIPALGHTYEADVTAPTCTEGGYTTYTCACGDAYISDCVDALGHTYESVTVEATCTEDGGIIYTCACGDGYTETLAAPGHSYEAVVTAPACAEQGFTTYICACGDAYTSDYVDALGHTYEAVTVAATCTQPGYTGYTCTACGDTYVSDETAALGHTYETATVEPTCDTAGCTTYTCHCGETYVSDEVPALGHVNVSVVTEATCETDGYTTHTCTVCGEVTVDTQVAALGHDYETVTVEATCTTNGSVARACVRCGESTVEVIPALGHSYEAAVTAPTCTEDGYTTYTCVCGDSYVADEVAALGHTYESVAVDATCTADGSVTYTCACGETYEEIIPALGHSYEAVVTEPTCTEDGYTTYTCVCGDSYVADETAALGHAYEAVVTEPTCTEDGYTTYTCVCGDYYIADEVAALGHSYTAVESNGYLVYTCGGCGDSYSEKIASTYTQVSTISSGNRCVITVYSGSTYYALSHAENEISVTEITVSNGVITSEVTEDLLWTYADSKLSYEDNGTTYYLYSSGANNWWGGWFGGSLTVSSSNSSTVSFSSNKLKVGSAYLRYSNGSFSLNRSASTAYVFAEE